LRADELLGRQEAERRRESGLQFVGKCEVAWFGGTRDDGFANGEF
jgi:hypothetical protein